MVFTGNGVSMSGVKKMLGYYLWYSLCVYNTNGDLHLPPSKDAGKSEVIHTKDNYYVLES